MAPFFRFGFDLSESGAFWQDIEPIRDEVFGTERLERHAASLASAQDVAVKRRPLTQLRRRLDDNAAVLLAAFRTSAAELDNNRDVVPAAEWLLDNYHLVEAQIREIRDDLPPGYYRQLPKLASGRFSGYPRVFGLAWAFVAHTDSNFDLSTLSKFLAAYQCIQPLTIGELWAVAITLRIVLVENLRRLTDQITIGLQARTDAEQLANRVLAPGAAHTALAAEITRLPPGPMSERFAAELVKLLREQDPLITPALPWLEERLAAQGSSIETVVRHAQQRQGASNVSVRNIITSMRLISDIDWGELVESVSLVDAKLSEGSGFADMDFNSRNTYRNAVEQLARGSAASELQIAEMAVAAAGAAVAGPAGDPGYHLVDDGRAALENAIGYRPPLRQKLARATRALGPRGYALAIMIVMTALLAATLWTIGTPTTTALIWFAIAAVLPASNVATALVNRAVAAGVVPEMLPGLELAAGVPTALRTLVAVPTMLSGEAELSDQIEQLEVHHLSGVGGDLSFVLLLDGVDSATEELDSDAPLLALVADEIDALNARYSPGPGGPRFWFLYRRRLWNAGENCWMGWERKRGKLHEMNRLLRGATDTNFIAVAGRAPALPVDVRYVITLDADTQLPRDAAVKLVGKMAHPLNRPLFDANHSFIIRGYGILQPRVTPSLGLGSEGSLYQAMTSGPGGIDPYAAAISDVYQDLFGEGSFTGKGIYDVDAFEAALAGRVPDNALLSHDLFEGIFARSGLASDIEVVEDFPTRYDDAARRQHRWTRGDWQLLPWLFGNRSSSLALPALGRWKMADNLRRSLVAPATVMALAAACLLTPGKALVAVFWLLAWIAAPHLLPVVSAVIPRRRGIPLGNHLAALRDDVWMALLQTGFDFAMLADQAWRMADAIGRTLWRLANRRYLLEWTTAAQAARRPRPNIVASYVDMAGGVGLTLAVTSGVLAIAPADAPFALALATLWLAAPALAWAASRPPAPRRVGNLAPHDAASLRRIARRTWRFFESFVTLRDNYLPPDNFQETPRPVVAHRTSPTNMGLYLLSTIAARDFGWIGTLDCVDRLEMTLTAMEKLARHRGHFFNWYDTGDLRVLEPPYVSSVDSGNLAGHLITLANCCELWLDTPHAPHRRAGIGDAVFLAREAVERLPRSGRVQIAPALAEIGANLTIDADIGDLEALAFSAIRALPAATSTDAIEAVADLHFWLQAVTRTAASHRRDDDAIYTADTQLPFRLQALAERARSMALAMDFAFLLDPERKLLSIGYSLADNSRDRSCYDLLASEARLASLFAIAKGDVPTRHWFHLGRTATPIDRASVLISWSGSMFEYLMPSLVMRAPEGSLLEQTNRRVVSRQRSYAQALGVPWGISESAYSARDLELTYQYSNFGVPGLGLKRGLSENLVIAPYATGLASMVDAGAACRNYDRLANMGALGRYGFYEALDFTRSRLPDGDSVAIVRTVMAHHQGMTIVAIANALHNAQMRTRFHREPMVQACSLLLQERMPRDVAVAHPRAEEVKRTAIEAISRPPAVRCPSPTQSGPPITHLLSSSAYSVMLTATGGGYSRWRDIAITRWREDATCDDWGSFIVLRDSVGTAPWCAAAKPIASLPDDESVVFAEDHATYVRRHGRLTTTTEVVVSGDGDGEVRRVTLTNSGRHTRTIELTSYSELVLTDANADATHPAFAKMFVETEFLPDIDALIARRRTRSLHEPPIWAAQLLVVEGETAGEMSYESDRARFIGRGRDIASAAAFNTVAPLSNTIGTVLDPVFALRQQVSIAPGKVARLGFWTLVAASRDELLENINRHRDRSAFERTQTLAWTQAQVQLRHLNISPDEAASFQQLAAPLLYADARFRPSAKGILHGAGPQSGLWPMSISGDLPIVLLRIDDIEDMAQVRQLLRAHQYWRLKGLSVDLVIVNEHASSYIQDLQSVIEAAVRTTMGSTREGEAVMQGRIFALRADLMSLDNRAQLQAVARIVLNARRGTLADQLGRLLDKSVASLRAYSPPPATPRRSIAGAEPLDLEFFNGLGGFDKHSADYVTVLADGATTPAPWINVIANPEFGMQVSADGSGYTWAENSKENQLTPWSNDPVRDPPGDALYVRDMVSGVLFGPTALPMRDTGRYIARHGFGYSRFEHVADGVTMELLQFVPLTDPLRVSRLRLTNTSGRRRQLSVTSYAELVLGSARSSTAPFIATEIDDETGAMLARNPWNAAFPGRVAFADLGGRQSHWTGDRGEFLGSGGSLKAPAALVHGALLSNRTGPALDPCAALQCTLDLDIGESVDIVSLLGQCPSADAASALVSRYRTIDVDAELAVVTAHWSKVLNTVQVETPDRAMDIMLNGRLLYQTLACRIWARAGFYQASGAYGFRDQLQDGMAICLARPDEARAHLLRAAGRQFPEGDVQHWWLPHSGQGVRTRISDDRVWLSFATATYVASTGDTHVLDEVLPFLEGPLLPAHEADSFFQPMNSDESASLFEHCARGLDQCLSLTGTLGMPLIGSGDWNDGMNRVGAEGRGESVWLGWLLIRTIALFNPLAEVRDPARAKRWRDHAEKVRAAIEANAWDGDWYRRATFDDGSWLGTADASECCIDSIAQSWAVLSQAADPNRGRQAMLAFEGNLVRHDPDLALLFTPPFDRPARDPGYIQGYPPGLRENGGQYSHAAMWAILAHAALGNGDKATALFALLNPINHALTPADVERYKVEPYAVAADVYSVAPHEGRGGWTWYTGAAGWMYRAGIEGILGLRREGNSLMIAPEMPGEWPGFSAKLTVGTTQISIVVSRSSAPQITIDGVVTLTARIPLDGGNHQMEMKIGLNLNR